MVEAHPEIVELDCNPLIAGPDGAVIVDARVRVETRPAAPDAVARALTPVRHAVPARAAAIDIPHMLGATGVAQADV